MFATNKTLESGQGAPWRGALDLTVDEAKAMAFGHLSSIDSLARRRFPRDENLALEGTQFVLDHLEMDDWRRLRAWKGNGDFLPFLATLTSRLLTDFFRAKCGYIRKPKWLEEKADPIWHLAYQLAIAEHGARQDVIETLLNHPPPRGRWFLEEVVRTVIGRCSERPRLAEAADDFEIEQIPDSVATEQSLEVQDKELMEVILAVLDGGGESVSPRVAAMSADLATHLNLTDEDCLLLKLYYLEDMSMDAIKRLLHLEGDLYKRVKKLIAQIGKACEKAGIAI